MKKGLSFKFWNARESGAVAWFVANSIPGCERGFGPCVASGVYRDGVLIGGTVYHNWNPEAGVMEMSGAGKNWWNRAYLKAVHDYIFNDAKCQLAVMRVAETNTRMLRAAERFGYSKHMIPRLRGRNEAEAILTLTDDDWRQSKFNR